MAGSAILCRHFKLSTSSAKPRNSIEQIDSRAAVYSPSYKDECLVVKQTVFCTSWNGNSPLSKPPCPNHLINGKGRKRKRIIKYIAPTTTPRLSGLPNNSIDQVNLPGIQFWFMRLVQIMT